DVALGRFCRCDRLLAKAAVLHLGIRSGARDASLGIPVPEKGAAGAHGHGKTANIAEFLAKELGERLPGVRFLPIDLTYILRAQGNSIHAVITVLIAAHFRSANASR